jgi:hypothetical protein
MRAGFTRASPRCDRFAWTPGARGPSLYLSKWQNCMIYRRFVLGASPAEAASEGVCYVSATWGTRPCRVLQGKASRLTLDDAVGGAILPSPAGRIRPVLRGAPGEGRENLEN